MTEDRLALWTCYDQGRGEVPRIGDKVETCHLPPQSTHYVGVFAGWATHDFGGGIVILDKRAPTGELAVVYPVVCLRKQ